MKKILHKAGERGNADYGWLKPNYYFSFAHYYDPAKIHFGLLRVLNDDFVAGGGGFPTHPHDNMEIVTIPLEGALQHKDSTGGEGIIKVGDVQIMSAGSGVTHSEFNASAVDPVKLFQVWLFPKLKNITPRYDQRHFNIADRQDRWQIVVSPREEDQALWINQDARFALSQVAAGQEINYQNAFSGNGVYLVVISGSVEVDGEVLNDRDAIGISESDSFRLLAKKDSALMAIEVPMR
jgi:redox-sensitive bicupin YhaK (pirin superfamily)